MLRLDGIRRGIEFDGRSRVTTHVGKLGLEVAG